MAGGMEMMMKSFGIDPKKIMDDFTSLKDGVTKLLHGIDLKLAEVERVQKSLAESQARIEASQETGLKLLEEITAWKRIKVQQDLTQRSLQNPPPPPLTLQPPPNQ
jgi:hypothetical protein